MIFMTALMRGMVDQMLKDGVNSLPGMVQVHNANYRDDPSIENSLAAPATKLLTALQDPLVRSWSSRVRVPAMISSEQDSRGVILLGIDPVAELSLSFDVDKIVEGRFLQGTDDKGLVIGRKLLQRLETRLGKRVAVMSQDPNNNVADRGFRIVGVYTASLESEEEQFIYAGRETVQSLLEMGTQVSEIAVNGEDYRDVAALQHLISTSASPDAEVLPWMELNSYLSLMLGMMDGIVLVWIIVIFLALSFGLANTLMMAVFERIREIGLMQALGMRPASILYLILVESLLLLLLGLLLGNLLAIGTILPLRDGIDVSAVAKGMEMMGAGSTLYPALKIRDLVTANVVVIVLGLLTSLLPAWRASRYRPVEAIAKI